ncbi:peptidoglycan recognition protein family protein [Patulibacter defluvii]|uniref:peptidoglycan recognition protein family protein n=1 Tax=Patulibacter defluvii TaxID=3095358 RepID=UPI002A75D315|nr:peptidoglycan recognition family protein [Patulibacter sp. DM4]
MTIHLGDTGPAVHKLKAATNTRLEGRDPAARLDSLDGPWNREAKTAAARAAYLLGVWGAEKRWGYTQAVLLDPDRRTAVERARGKTRTARAKAAAKHRGRRPKIVLLQAPMENRFGSIGSLYRWTGHYTAGPRDTSDAHALELDRQYNAQHRAQGWGAIGYHYNITSAGTIIVLRPVAWKGAHVAANNTGNAGIMVHGHPGQRMTAPQRAALRWLLDNAHTTAMPARGRAPKRLSSLRGSVHSDWMSTSCPGDFIGDYRKAA